MRSVRARTGLSLAIGIAAAFREMRSQPVRSILSMSGVALAVGALVALLSIIGGLRVFLDETMAELGGPGRMAVQRAEPADARETRLFGRSRGLRAPDADAVDSVLAGRFDAMRTTGGWTTGQYAGRETRVYLLGLEPDYLLRDLRVRLVRGRLPSATEYARGEPVALLGWELADRMEALARARGDSLVGSAILIEGVRYRVVGTFTLDRSRNWRHATSVFAPYRAVERFHKGVAGGLGEIQLRLEQPDRGARDLPLLSALLLARHRGARDFSFRMFEWIEEFRSMVGNVALLFGIVAALSLSVGALGIVNVMLASLSDRVREIGIRKALGATPLQIGIQFLAESVTLSLVGGLAGLALGASPVLFGEAIENASQIRPILTPGPALLALAIAAAVGAIAGLAPAWKAMRLDPIEALRYE